MASLTPSHDPLTAADSAITPDIFVMSDSKTWEALVDGQSLARYGDGELAIILRRGIWFQKRSRRLAVRLRETLRSTKLLIGIPPIGSAADLQGRGFSPAYVDYCSQLLDMCDPQITYGSSLITRIGHVTHEELRVIISRFHALVDGRHVVVVKGNDGRSDHSILERYADRVSVVDIPAKNAFSYYDEITENIRAARGADSLVLISAGPTATILAADLAAEGQCQAIDFGHFWVTLEQKSRLMDIAI